MAHRIEGPFSLTTAEAVAADRLVRLTAAAVTCQYCDAGEEPCGITTELAASGAVVAVHPISAPGVAKLTASKAITAGTVIYTAADGKVSDAEVGRRLGVALTAATGDGGKISAVLGIFAGDPLITEAGTVRWMEDWITGVNQDGHKISETADKGDWLLTLVDGDTDGGDVCKVTDDAPGGVLTITTNNKASDSMSLQLNGESFKLAVGKPLFFEALLGLDDVDKADFFIGLCLTDTTPLDNNDRVGFMVDHDGNIDFISEQDGTETDQDTTADIADATVATAATTFKRLAFYWDGVNTLTPYVNGVAYAVITDNGTTILVCDDEALTPTIHLATSAAQVVTAFIDYIRIVATR